MSHSLDIGYVRGVFWVAAAAALWSTGGALIKAVELDSFQVSFWRSVFAFITLVAFVRPRRISLEWSNVIASFAYAFTLLFFVVGTKLTTAANAIFLQYTAPLYIVGFSYFLFREKFRRGEMLALLFCIIGIVLFFSDQVDFTGFAGMLWSLASGVTYAAFIVTSKRRTRGHYAEPVMLGAFLCMIMGFIIVALSPENPESVMDLSGFAMTFQDGLILVFLGVFQIGLPCFIYMKGLKAVSPLEAGVITMIEPICNPVWAYLLVYEIPSTNTMIGGGGDHLGHFDPYLADLFS